MRIISLLTFRLAAFLRDHSLAVVVGAGLGYALLFPALYRALGFGAVTFSLVPVALAGWYFGLSGGLLASLCAFAANLLLGILIGGAGVLQALVGAPGMSGLALFLTGGALGYLSDLKERLAVELSNRQKVEMALRVSETFNQAVLQALSANIAVLSRTGEIVAVNQAWKKFASDNGAPGETTGVGVNYLKVCRSVAGESGESAVAAQTAVGIQAVLEGRDSLFTLEYPCHSPRQKRWFVLHVTPLAHDQGGAVVSHINITDRVQSEQKLAFLATHDALTGLYNRAFFEQELARLKEEQAAPVSVMMGDIDGLKQVNDGLGHAAGDALIRRAAEVLRGAFRDDDVVARIGGDEFAVLLPGVDEKLSATILARVTAHLRKAAADPVPLRMSLGIATAQNSEDILPAMKRADEKMYQEKAAGR